MFHFLKSYASISVLAVMTLFAAQVSAQPEEQSARQVVESFQANLLAVMKQGKELGYQGRYEKLYNPIVDSHDLTKITRIVVGREWQKLNNEQRLKLVDVFSRFSVASYAYNFKDFSGESFRYDSEETTKRGGIVVHTFLVIPDDKDVKFDYMLKKSGDKWRIINVIAKGVSDLALRRSEYTSILKRDGFDALIVKISEKIENYSKS